MLQDFFKLLSKARKRRQAIRRLQTTDPVQIFDTARFTFPENIRLGRYTRVSKDCYLNGQGGITIGDGTILGPNVTILSSTHRYQQTKYLPYDEYDDFRPVTIGRGVWLGWGCMVVPGVTIGDGAIVAMGAVVTRDVAVGAIVGGNPARLLKQRDADWITRTIQEERYYMRAMIEEGVRRIKTKPPDSQGNTI